MATDIAGSVTSEYTSVVEVPADTDILSEAGLTDMMLAGLNRTEFVRQNTPILATSIRRIVDVHEEFLSVDWNNSRQVLHADRNWKTSSAGSPTVAFRANAAGQPGGLRATMGTSGGAFACYLGSASTSQVFRTAEFDRFACIVHLPTTISDKQFRVGLSQDVNGLTGGTHGLAFVRESAEANYQIYAKTSGGEDQIDSGVTVTADEDVLFELVRASSGTWSVRVNEVEITTLTSPANRALTTETFNLGAYFICGTAATRVFDLLQIDGRTTALGNRYD